MQGAIGYLYAEQELHEISKIFGYGYGANTNLKTQFTTGGPFDNKSGFIEGSGSRSIMCSDFLDILGITEEDVGMLEDSIYYSVESNPTVKTYYLALNTDYGYVKTRKTMSTTQNGIKLSEWGINNTKLIDVLFSNKYLVATRRFWTNEGMYASTNYGVYNMAQLGTTIDGVTTWRYFLHYISIADTRYSSALDYKTSIKGGILPVVCLIPNVIDKLNPLIDGETYTWNLN